MAKIRLGALAQDIRGSQAGLTFSRNKGGAYVRQRVAPTNVSSDARTRQRNIFSANSKAWGQTLTEDQRGAWKMFALSNPVTDVFGASIILSGIAMYQRLNSVLQTIGAAVIADPPTSLVVTPNALANSFTVDTTSPAVSFGTEVQATNAGTKYYIFATQQMSPGRAPQKSDYRFIGVKPSVAAAVTVDITLLWTGKYGVPVADMKYAILVAQVDIASGAVLAGQVFTAIGA